MSAVALLISDMVRQGVDPDLIGRVAEVLAERAPAVDAQAERRRAKDRARKASIKEEVVPQNSAESAEQRIPPEPPKKTTLSPPLKGGIFPTKSGEAQPEKPASEPAKALSAWVSEIWDQTPVEAHRRSSRRELETALKSAGRRGHEPSRILAALVSYYGSDDATKQDRKFAKGVHVMVENDRWEAFEAPEDVPPDDPDPWRTRLLRWNTAGYWNSEWGPKPGKPGYEGPALESLAA